MGQSCASADVCPVEGGVEWQCKKRFMYGTNWAWREFAADFGGVAAWGKQGVSEASDAFDAGMREMKQAGVNVIRWWMFPAFRTDSIKFGPDDAPTGIGGTLKADIEKALELADRHDLYIMLTLFSFDNFEHSEHSQGIQIRSIKPMVTDASRRRKLLENLVAPVARAVEGSPFKHRMIAWDMINEPEWAMKGPNLHGPSSFDPMKGLEPVTHRQMETFLGEMADVLHEHSSALVTIGQAGAKWARAWINVDVDFHQLHYYDWLYEWYPYKSKTLEALGLTGKPVVMGEFPAQGLSAIPSRDLPAVPMPQLVEDLYALGYAGTLSWDYGSADFPFKFVKADHRRFTEQNPCEATFGSLGGDLGDPRPPAPNKEPAPKQPAPGGGSSKTCTDLPPPGDYTCAQQEGWGKCDEPWMEGKCDKTCGRC
jgi:hypothetical protein